MKQRYSSRRFGTNVVDGDRYGVESFATSGYGKMKDLLVGLPAKLGYVIPKTILVMAKLEYSKSFNFYVLDSVRFYYYVSDFM